MNGKDIHGWKLTSSLEFGRRAVSCQTCTCRSHAAAEPTRMSETHIWHGSGEHTIRRGTTSSPSSLIQQFQGKFLQPRYRRPRSRIEAFLFHISPTPGVAWPRGIFAARPILGGLYRVSTRHRSGGSLQFFSVCLMGMPRTNRLHLFDRRAGRNREAVELHIASFTSQYIIGPPLAGPETREL